MKLREAAQRLISFALLVVMISSLIVLPKPVKAADPNGGALNLITSPLPISLVAKPGTTVSTDLKVKNGGSQTEHLKLSLLKFGAYGEEGKPRILDPGPNDKFFDWVTFSKSTFDAEPNVWNTIKMTIKVPSTAAFGYYYAAVFSRANPDKASGEKETTIAGATATLVLLEARVPNAKRDIQVASFSAKKKIYEYLPADFLIRLRNSGNVHAAPRGNIFISQGKKSIGTIEVNPEQGNVLPNSYRVFESSFSDGFPFYADKVEDGKVVLNKNSDPVRHLKWDFNNLSKFRFGKFTADMVLVYDDGTKDIPIEAVVDFWVIPWRGILVLLLIFGLIGFGIYTAAKNALGNLRQKPRKR